MTVVSIGGSYVGQHLVGRVGTRPVATASLALFRLAGLSFAGTVQWGGPVPVPVLGMFPFGLGMGGTRTAGSVASLADVPAAHSGVAAGVKNLSFGVGTTLGVAALSTVAAATASYLTSAGMTRDVGDARGQEAAFLASAVIAFLGCGTSRLIPAGSVPKPPPEHIVLVAGPDDHRRSSGPTRS